MLSHLFRTERCRSGLLGLCLFAAACALVMHPDHTAQAVRAGLALCGNVILPSLFPFFVLSSLVIELGMSRYLGRMFEPVMRPLFRISGNCAAALALGFIGGYPVGARTAIHLYRSGQCSRTEAERLLAFCNNCGPAFIFGVVGAGILNNSRAGLLLYLTHMLASLAVGILFRFYRSRELPQASPISPVRFQSVRFSAAFTQSIQNALQSSLSICAFIVVFTVILQLLALSGLLTAAATLLGHLFAPFGLSDRTAGYLLAGLLEISSGVSSLTEGPLPGRIPLAAFMLGWAGVSVHLQVISFMGDCGLSVRTYLTGKLLHGLLSAWFADLALPYFFPNSSIPTYLQEQAETIAALDFSHAAAISFFCAGGMWIIFFLLVCHVLKKSSRKNLRHAL